MATRGQDGTNEGYELVRITENGEFRTVGIITDPGESAFLLQYLNARFQQRTYMLRKGGTQTSELNHVAED